MTDSPVLRHVIASITPASAAHAEAARRRVTGAQAPLLERLAVTLGGAQHTARPRSERRVIVVCAGDHGVGDPGIALGAAHPTVIAAHAIADGSAALAQLARANRAPLVLVDAGVREPAEMPATAVRLWAGAAPSHNLMSGPSMTPDEAARALEAGIALAVSLADDGLDVVALGALGVGADVASAALLGAALRTAPTGLADPMAEAAGARGAELAIGAPPAMPRDAPPLAARTDAAWGAPAGLAGGERLSIDAGANAWAARLGMLAALGGPDTFVLAGLMLAAASTNVPVILDGYATGAAALVAVALAPTVTGYLVAAHTGGFTQPRILAHLGLHPVFDVGLGHGEGTGAAMILPLIDQVTALASRG
jgi:nicotinate-nucleotide--dimethylbenzimidazole phosphoribosyltransferase